MRLAHDILMFGRKVTAEELVRWGMVNRVFKPEGFHDEVIGLLDEQLQVNDGKSMIEAKRLTTEPLRNGRLLALYHATDAVAERFVEDGPTVRFATKNELLTKGLTIQCVTLYGFTANG